MPIPDLKYAVYYGTITLIDGTPATFTAAEIAELYGVDAEPYLAIPLVGSPSPFLNGADELSYVHLKPLPDGRYYDAPTQFNADNETQWGEDFDARRGGKWAVRPENDSAFDEE